jgi:hypothetical protein
VSEALSSGPDTGATDELLSEEVRRIAQAARFAEHKAQLRRRERARQLRGWAGLAAGVCLVLGLVAGFPEKVVQAAPAAARLYELAGKKVNIYGLTIHSVRHQYMLIAGEPVLAIRGQVANVSGDGRRVPALRFTLKDAAGKALHSWTLNSIGRGPIGAGASTSFVTRLAAPPAGVESLEIRFARPGEIG